MPSVRPRRGKRKRRVSPAAEEEAVKTADYFLGPFIGDVTSWNEYGSDAGNPKRELNHAIALIETILNEAAKPRPCEQDALTPAGCLLVDYIPGIEIARKAAIPILKRARPAAGRNSLSWRDQLIMKTIEAVCSRHELNPTRNPGSRDEEHDPSGCSVVAEALRRRRIKLGEKRITDEIWLKRTPPKL